MRLAPGWRGGGCCWREGQWGASGGLVLPQPRQLLSLMFPTTPLTINKQIHVGKRGVDFPPPLVALEPPAPPADPQAPPAQLPSLSPPQVFYGCRRREVRWAARWSVPSFFWRCNVLHTTTQQPHQPPAATRRHPTNRNQNHQGSFTEADLIPLPDSSLPTVEPVTTFDKFLAKARKGELYVNLHSVRMPKGEARGNLHSA
jgi:hypothetical protein